MQCNNQAAMRADSVYRRSHMGSDIAVANHANAHTTANSSPIQLRITQPCTYIISYTVSNPCSYTHAYSCPASPSVVLELAYKQARTGV